MKRHSVEYGRSKRVIRFSRTLGIAAHHCDHRPGRHGSRVVVAGNAAGGLGAIFVNEFARELLRAPFLAVETVVEVRIVDVRFVGGIDVTVVEDFLLALYKLFL